MAVLRPSLHPSSAVVGCNVNLNLAPERQLWILLLLSFLPHGQRSYIQPSVSVSRRTPSSYPPPCRLHEDPACLNKILDYGNSHPVNYIQLNLTQEKTKKLEARRKHHRHTHPSTQSYKLSIDYALGLTEFSVSSITPSHPSTPLHHSVGFTTLIALSLNLVACSFYPSYPM